MIAVRTRGNFDNTEKYLKSLASKDYRPILDAYARRGLEALINATPVDTGITAESWGYKIQNDSHGVSIEWYNTNTIDGYAFGGKGTPVIILLQYGHATGTGGYVEGYDIINPAIRPIFDELSKELWEEVKR